MTGGMRWWETRRFALIVVLAAIVPLLLPDVAPLIDLPGHIGRFRVMLGTDADVLGQWYRFEWRLVGNLGVDLLVTLLGPVIGLEPAVKLVVMAIPALTVIGMLWISHEVHGRTTPMALFALALVYNYPFHFGFVNYALSMALALNAFALWLRLGRQGHIRLRAALFVPIGFAVWVCHVMGWGTLGLLAFGAEVVRQRQQGRGWPAALLRASLACLPLALPLVLILAWRSDGSGVGVRFLPPTLKLAWLAVAFRDRWMVFDLACTALVVGVLYRGVREKGFGFAPGLGLAALLLLGAYLALPYILFGSAYADMRLAPFVLILGLLAMRSGEGVSARQLSTLALLGLALFGARIAGTTASFWLYDRSYDRQLAALDHVPRGSRVLSLVGSTCDSPWDRTRLDHLGGLALARRAAFSNDQWRFEGAPLLSVTTPAMGEFATDPSELAPAVTCPLEPMVKPIGETLRQFPRASFDYVWLIDPPAYDPRLTTGMAPVWRDGSSVLYRIR